MINYEYNPTLQRWEFIFSKDGKYTPAYLKLGLSEEEKIRNLVNWFNSLLRLTDASKEQSRTSAN